MFVKGSTATEGLSVFTLLASCSTELRRWTGQIDEKHMHRLVDVLHGLFALVDKGDVQLVSDLISHNRRARDAAGRGEPLKTRRDVHALSVEVLALDNQVTEVQAEPEHDAAVFRTAGRTLCHPALDIYRAPHSIHYAAEFSQRAVAHQLEDPPLVAGDGRLEKLLPMPPKFGHRAFLVHFHEMAVADYVRSKDGGKSSFDPTVLHPRSTHTHDMNIQRI